MMEACRSPGQARSFESVVSSEGAPRRNRNSSAEFQQPTGGIPPRSLDKLGMTAVGTAQNRGNRRPGMQPIGKTQ